jgi:hypothetical protein
VIKGFIYAVSLREGESMTTPAASAAFQLCADFAPFPVSIPLGTSVSIAGFKFLEQSMSGSMRVIESTDARGISEKGLIFDVNGVEIILPVPVRAVNMRIGAFTNPMDILAFDSARNQVHQLTVSNLNEYMNIPMSAPEIASVVLRGGTSNDHVLVHVCITVLAL